MMESLWKISCRALPAKTTWAVQGNPGSGSSAFNTKSVSALPAGRATSRRPNVTLFWRPRCPAAPEPRIPKPRFSRASLGLKLWICPRDPATLWRVRRARAQATPDFQPTTGLGGNLHLIDPCSRPRSCGPSQRSGASASRPFSREMIKLANFCFT